MYRKGYFPSTAVGLEENKFAFVMLDVDIFQASVNVFEFFYPRMVRGGYFYSCTTSIRRSPTAL